MGGPRSLHVRLAIAVTISGAIAGSAGACVGLDGLAGGTAEGPTPTPPDGGRDNPCAKNLDDDHDNCGACGTVCGGMEHCLAGACAPGCPDHTVYVSADGNDNASGCTPATPKRTVGAAIALLKTLAAQKHEVHMCRGQYDEAVVLDYPTSILGGYECSTWKRSTSYGAPTFDGVNESVILGTALAAPLTATSVEGVTIDGLTLHARDATSVRLAAAVVQSRAKLKITNTKAIGGAGDAKDSPASAGLVVDTDAFADVASAVIDGGGAKNSSNGGYGSAGIFLTSKGGGIHVTESRITGGGGVVTGGTGSIGVLALGGSSPSSIERSNVDGGSGHVVAGSASYGIGFFSGTASDLRVADSVIAGGSSGCSKNCSITGLSTTAIGKVTLTGNRISGGEVKSELFGDISYTGMHLSDYASADVQNNSVFSGNTKESFSAAAAAIVLTRGGSALVANNTFAIGPSKTSVGSVVVASSKTATFANNLFFDAAAASTGAAVDLDACDGRTYALRNNAWVGFPAGGPLLQLATGTQATTCTTAADVTVDALESTTTKNFGASATGGNTRLAASCSGDTKCDALAACSAPGPCLATVLGTWNKATAGDVLGAGWKLAAGVDCAIALGGTSAAGLAGTDGYGVARTTPFSMGASEHDGACTNVP
jgi:hypothetical protein